MSFTPGIYDRAITIFSPEGRLFQVEYAFETVNKGATIIGVRCLSGVVLGAEERVNYRLEDLSFTQKIYEVDEHIGAALAGIAPDGRVLIDQARVYAQSNRLLYDEPIDVEVLAKRVGDIMQLYTQHAAVRPFGVSIIFGGVDKTGPRLFVTDPSGSRRAYRAVALGMGRERAERILKEKYREEIRLGEAVRLVVNCLSEAAREREEACSFRIAVIPSATMKFRVLTEEEVNRYAKLI